MARHAGRAPIRAAIDGPWAPSPERVAELLRHGNCWSERWFDQLLSPRAQRASKQHFTPIAVTRRAAEWIRAADIRSVLDVGSGAGKFCVATALAAPSCAFVGLEHRADLVREAESLAARLGVADRVTFLEGALGSVPLPRVDAYYLFNPFGENLYGRGDHIDEAVELGVDRHERDVALVHALLDEAPAGTWVLDYNGFGAEMPNGYEPARIATDLACPLRLWRRA